MAALTQVAVPDIGDFSDVPVIEILVAEGDSVELDSPLVTLESDKATMEIPSPVAGKVEKILVELGDRVAEGTPLVEIAGTGTPAAPAPKPAAEEVPPPAAAGPSAAAGPGAPPPPALGDGHAPAVHASPLARRIARELGVDLASIRGTGRNGRILREDVEAAAARPAGAAAAAAGAAAGAVAPSAGPGAGAAAPPAGPGAGAVAPPAGPAAPPSPAGPGAPSAPGPGVAERVPLSRIQKIAAPRLTDSWQTIPHVTHHEDADITGLEEFRKQVNAEHPKTKVTMVALLMKAVVASLREFPDFNASLDGDEIVRWGDYNIGFAADTPHGLMVPVVEAVDRKGLLQVAAELRELSQKARDGKIGPADLRGSTFTISSLGGIGGTGFTPIINAPEVAILGVTRSAVRPVWNGSEFEPRLIVPLSLSYDHRVIDGAAAARFMVHLASVLGDLRRVLL